MVLPSAFDGSGTGSGARRDYQPVIVNALAAGKGDLSLRMRDRGHFRAGSHVHIPLAAKILRRVGDELIERSELTFEKIRQAARSPCDGSAFFENQNIE